MARLVCHVSEKYKCTIGNEFAGCYAFTFLAYYSKRNALLKAHSVKMLPSCSQNINF